MVRCSVLGCKSDSDTKIDGLSFHVFPKEPELRKLWVAATGRNDWLPKKRSTMCSAHFDSALLWKRGKKTYLYPNAAPIKANIDSSASTSTTPMETQQTETTSLKHASEVKKDISVNVDSSASTSTSTTPMETQQTETTSLKHASEVKKDISVKVKSLASTSATPMEPQQSETTTSEHAYEVDNIISGKSPEYTPRTLKRKWKQEQEVSQQRLAKLKALREKTRRLTKKVANLENILAELQSKLLVQSEDCELLATIDTANKDFLKKILSPTDSKRKYSPSLRKFALCLHFISPRAYTYVRKTFNTCLPHPSTLRSWYKSIDGSPGFTQESLHCIKVLAGRDEIKGRTLFCALSMDEMAIRKHIQWDGKKCVGFVNFGEDLEGDSIAVAREALVFMVTAINGSWKLPVGYFLIDGCNGEQKANLVRQCVEHLTSCGVKTVSLTFDGCPANFAMAKNLGCLLETSDTTNMKCSFKVGEQDIVIFPDPSHMLKLVRNTLGDKKELSDLNGDQISWSYISQLHELQQKEGLHFANKLRSQHVNYCKQIMKVRLAAQTFSNSVATAIQFCDKELHLPEFFSSKATVEFIKKFDTLFDILNSRNLQAFTYKKPINKNNFQQIVVFLDKMENYLNGIKLCGQPIMKTNRKVGFMGFFICIKSLKSIYQNYVASGDISFVPMYKLSQDHLECFFSSVRARGGFNNNPTAVQFSSAYKRLIVHGEIKHLTSGNCIPLEDIKILTFSDIRHETKLNLFTKLCDSEEVDVPLTEHIIDSDHDYLADPTRLSIYHNEIITYIAGFIVRKLRKVIRCGDCLFALISEKFKGIIEKRDKGGLIYPSKDVVQICNNAEKTFRRHSHQGSSFFSDKNLLPKLVVPCFKVCSSSNSKIFQNAHFDSQPLIGNHRSLLIKAVAMHYFETRIHHATKERFAPEQRVRNVHTKLVLFKGQ